MKNPSTIDWLHNGGPRVSDSLQSIHENAKRREAEAPKLQLEASVRALPDDLFKDHPGVIEAKRALKEKQQRVERLRHMPPRSALDDALRGLEAMSLSMTAELREAAVDDVLDGAYDFPRTVAAMERAEHIERQLKAAQLASKVTGQSLPNLSGELSEGVHLARNVLSDLLLQLKRDYLNEHPKG